MLGSFGDGAERNHDLRHRGLQFERRGLRVGDVGNDELGQPREHLRSDLAFDMVEMIVMLTPSGRRASIGAALLSFEAVEP